MLRLAAQLEHSVGRRPDAVEPRRSPFLPACETMMLVVRDPARRMRSILLSTPLIAVAEFSSAEPATRLRVSKMMTRSRVPRWRASSSDTSASKSCRAQSGAPRDPPEARPCSRRQRGLEALPGARGTLREDVENFALRGRTAEPVVTSGDGCGDGLRDERLADAGRPVENDRSALRDDTFENPLGVGWARSPVQSIRCDTRGGRSLPSSASSR